MVNTNSTTHWLTSVTAIGLSCVLDARQCVSSGGLKTNVTPSRLCTPCRQAFKSAVGYLKSFVVLPVLPSRRPAVVFLGGCESSASVEIRCDRESEKHSTQLATLRGFDT